MFFHRTHLREAREAARNIVDKFSQIDERGVIEEKRAESNKEQKHVESHNHPHPEGT